MWGHFYKTVPTPQKNFSPFYKRLPHKSCCKIATHNDFLAILTGGSKIYNLLLYGIATLFIVQ